MSQFSLIFAGKEEELAELIRRIAKKLNVALGEEWSLSKQRVNLTKNWIVIPHTIQGRMEAQFAYDIRNVSDDLKKNLIKLDEVAQEEKVKMCDIILECMGEQ